ncbi:unnamed protein product, partial [Cylicocyclus nassatus]
ISKAGFHTGVSCVAIATPRKLWITVEIHLIHAVDQSAQATPRMLQKQTCQMNSNGTLCRGAPTDEILKQRTLLMDFQ